MPPSPMGATFNLKLINQESFDPGLYVSLTHQKRAIIFDLPEMGNLAPREVLKIRDALVSHTHMDHFIGFDSLLRMLLGREGTLRIIGPRGLGENVEGKLRGYTWNLIQNYEGELIIEVWEVSIKGLRKVFFSSRHRFSVIREEDCPFSPTPLLHEPGFRVHVAVLDHQIPCLAFMLEEDFKINILKDRLNDLGLEPGPWLSRFKQEIYLGNEDNREFVIRYRKGSRLEEKTWPLKTLKSEITKLTKGTKIVYITDIIGTEDNIEKICKAFGSCDQAYIEASFLEKDLEQARRTYHLTAMEAGRIAGLLGAKYLMVFHHSFRYRGLEHELQEEALKAFRLQQQDI